MPVVTDQPAARASISRLLSDSRLGVRNVGRRAATTITLAAVLAIAALAYFLAPPRVAPATKPAPVGASEPSDFSRSVKIVGAAPRGTDCADQVWPYIEPRCLTRADTVRDEPIKRESAPPVAAVPAPEATTTGAAPVEPTAPSPVDPAKEAPPATAVLQLPRPAVPAANSAGLPIPPGAVPLTGARAGIRHCNNPASVRSEPAKDPSWTSRGGAPAVMAIGRAPTAIGSAARISHFHFDPGGRRDAQSGGGSSQDGTRVFLANCLRRTLRPLRTFAGFAGLVTRCGGAG